MKWGIFDFHHKSEIRMIWHIGISMKKEDLRLKVTMLSQAAYPNNVLIPRKSKKFKILLP
jgi:hypothetical protein